MPVEFMNTTLENGLRIVAEVDEHAHSAAMGFFVKTGARDELPRQMGVSHFLEHMMFKGTDKRSASDVDRDLDDIGARSNAWTSAELTAFHAHCLPQHLAAAEDVLSDILRPSLRVEDFEDEKPVILEEIAMYADQPSWQLYERTLEVYYDQHPLSHRVLGTNETVSQLQRDEMMAYFQQRYSADNTVVALAGKIDFQDMVGRIKGHCGGWSRTDAARTYAPFTPLENRFTDTDASLNRHYACMVAPAPPVQDDRRYPAMMLAHILGHFEGSRLYWALVEPGLAEEAQCHYDGRDGCGEFMHWICCRPEDAEQCEQVLLKTIDELTASLCEDDLARVRSLAATSVTVAGEMPAGRMQRLGRIMATAETYRSLDQELEQIHAVTLDDLLEVATAFPMSPIVTGHRTPTSD